MRKGGERVSPGSGAEAGDRVSSVRQSVVEVDTLRSLGADTTVTALEHTHQDHCQSQH